MYLTHRFLLWFSSSLILSAKAWDIFLKYGSVAEELQCLGAHNDDNLGVLVTVKAIDIQEDGTSTVLKKTSCEEAPMEVTRRLTAATSEEKLTYSGWKLHGVDILWY